MVSKARGFTLVELVLVITLTSIIATVIGLFIRPAIDSYFAAQRRAAITDIADTALRLMARDIRLAVPNSIRMVGSSCFELLPTSTGGRYRTAPDGVTGNGSYFDGTNLVTAGLDSLSPLTTVPTAGDWLIIDNQNTNDAYTTPAALGSGRYGGVRARIASVNTTTTSERQARITLDSSYTGGFQFPVGYNGGRFVVVPDSQQAVFYVCSGATGSVDAGGDGQGKLYRISGYGFNASAPTSCPATTGAQVVASHVRSCTFVYDPNHGSTQQSGFMWMQLDITRAHDSVSLSYGAHVDNLP